MCMILLFKLENCENIFESLNIVLKIKSMTFTNGATPNSTFSLSVSNFLISLKYFLGVCVLFHHSFNLITISALSINSMYVTPCIAKRTGHYGSIFYHWKSEKQLESPIKWNVCGSFLISILQFVIRLLRESWWYSNWFFFLQVVFRTFNLKFDLLFEILFSLFQQR